ncbi:MAG: hypothetical protein WDO56_09745 [Gammaproteobacteria bacterium]
MDQPKVERRHFQDGGFIFVRRVACFAATSLLRSNEARDTELQRLLDVLQEWLEGKGLTSFGVDHESFKLKGGDTAQYAKRILDADDSHGVEVTLDQISRTSRFHSRLCLGTRDNRLHVFVELSAGAPDYTVAPLTVDVRSPRVLHALLAARTWTAGATPIPVKPIEWHGAEGAKRFAALVRHPERNLPIIAVSRYQGQTLTPEFARELLTDLVGLTLIVDLDDLASRGVTQLLGREWACYGGAVRIYWPFKGPSVSAYKHPLWTRERLIANAGSTTEAATRIRTQLRRRMFALSTFTVDEPADLRHLRENANRAQFERMRKIAEEKGDQGALAEEYFNRCVELEARVQKLAEANDLLSAQVRSYTNAWRQTETSSEEDIQPEPIITVSTVAEAVSRGQLHFAEDLVFGADALEAVSTLAEDAGPPEKIYQHFKTLAEMTRARRNGGLGKDMVIWLKDQGVKASSESETIRNSATEMRKRTWRDGSHTRPFDMHLKPNDHTSPDRCVRIYFDYDDQLQKTVIGYVGRHF